MAQDELSQPVFEDDIGYKTPAHVEHHAQSPSIHANTQEEPSLTQADIPLNGQPNSTVVLTHSDCLPILVPTIGRGLVEISEYHLALSFTLELHTVVVSKDVKSPCGLTVGVTHIPPSRCNELGHNFWSLSADTYCVSGIARQVLVHHVTCLSDATTQSLSPGNIYDNNSIVSPVVTPSVHANVCDTPLPSLVGVEDDLTEITSVVDILKRLGSNSGASSLLKDIDFQGIAKRYVRYLPREFNGDILFEFQPILMSTSGSISLLAGMDRRYDGHVWTQTKTTNIRNTDLIKFRYAHCVGHLRCGNSLCSHVRNHGRPNETSWDGVSTNPLAVGSLEEQRASLICSHCKLRPECIGTCPAKMLYVVHNRHDLTRACVHIGRHAHPVALGECRETIQTVKKLVREEVARSPGAPASAIALAVSKNWLATAMLAPVGETATPFDLTSMKDFMGRFKNISSPNIRNHVHFFKSSYAQKGSIDKILELKSRSHIDFIQDSQFPGQGSSKVYLFKMSSGSPGSGVDLVRRMQPGGDLQDAWLMFDHTYRVKGWTTMACHVYDPVFRRVMTIAICDMQSEDADSQCLLWFSMINLMKNHGLSNINFKGFMADSAQANFIGVRRVFGSGNPKEPIQGGERTCGFHWEQSFEKHKKHVQEGMRMEFVQLVYNFKESKSDEDAQLSVMKLRHWIQTSGSCNSKDQDALLEWLAYWHFRFHQWGCATLSVSFYWSL